MSRSKIHAILPAAGHSRRMGQSKLLLPWGTTTVIEQLLTRLLDANLASVSILVRSEDAPLAKLLEAFRDAQTGDRSSHLHVVCAPQPPAEMRDSVSLLLSHVLALHTPHDADGWMLVPADSVAVEPATLSAVIEQWRRGNQKILIPTHAGRRGHPAIFAWTLASHIDNIPIGHGVNWLCAQPEFHIQEYPVADPAVLADLDTPEDYDRWHVTADQ